MEEINYDKLQTIWDNPDQNESVNLWIKLCKEEYSTMQGDCGNCLEQFLLDDGNGLKAYLMKEDMQFFDIVYSKYGRWKYTDYRFFSKYKSTNIDESTKINFLKDFKGYIGKIETNKFCDEIETKKFIKEGLKYRFKLPGIGVAGMSGILSLILPDKFGVVDRYVAMALETVAGIKVSHYDDLSDFNAAELEWCMIEKARKLNELKIGDIHWTPRDIDKALWSYRVKDCKKCGALCNNRKTD